MLRPTEHTHPDHTVIHLALLLLARLRERRVDPYPSLREFATKAVDGGDVLFVPTLCFLYLLGLVGYRRKTNALEYVGPNEAVQNLFEPA